MRSASAEHLANGTKGHGHAEIRRGDATEIQRASDGVLARRGDGSKLPPLRKGVGNPKLEREAQLRALAIRRGEYKTR